MTVLILKTEPIYALKVYLQNYFKGDVLNVRNILYKDRTVADTN